MRIAGQISEYFFLADHIPPLFPLPVSRNVQLSEIKSHSKVDNYCLSIKPAKSSFRSRRACGWSIGRERTLEKSRWWATPRCRDSSEQEFENIGKHRVLIWKLPDTALADRYSRVQHINRTVTSAQEESYFSQKRAARSNQGKNSETLFWQTV